ncbi:hypothetical protein JTB14_006752 [Gonioctena quinquepunctata]|nr:hypothetical protein JTB14_006752 [Gonioctena quinquepunctata]
MAEDLTKRALERLQRSSNVIIANLLKGNRDADTATARQIIQLATGIYIQHITVVRIGNTDGRDRQKLIKVNVGKSDVVKQILRNKSKLPNSQYREIKIFDDQTPAQRKYLDDKRAELKI